MKITESILKKLIRESIQEAVNDGIADPRMDSREPFGQDNSEEEKHVRDTLGSEEDVVEKLERAIADLQAVASELAKKLK